MTTRLVAVGDLHLHPGDRQPDRLRALDQIVAEGRALEGLAAWLVVGDVFHSRSTAEDRNAFAARLALMVEVAPVVIAQGNHDAPNDLDIFARLRGRHPVTVVTTPQLVRLAALAPGGQDISVWCLPYPTRAGLVSAGVAKGDVIGAAAEALEFIIMQAAGELAEAQARGDITLLLAHANITGAIASNGNPQIGQEIELHRGHLDRLGAIPKLFGHIHKPQTIHGAEFVGSVCRLSYGELEAKRYVVVEYAADRSWRLVSCPLEVAPMYQVEGTLTREGFTWAVVDGPGGAPLPAPETWRGADVRVRYRFQASEKNVLLHAIVQAKFAEAARLTLEPIAVPDRQLRAPAVAAARTLAEKVAAYSQVEALAPALAEKLAALDQHESATVLGDVARLIAAIESDAPTEVAAWR